jgi:hypothetical protein
MEKRALTRKHISPWSISGNRSRDFMETLFRKGLKNCSYQTLLYEAQNFFETNDPRTIDRYIGSARYKTKDILHVQRLLGHKNIQNTLIYVDLESQLFSKSSDGFTVRIAHDVGEAAALTEVGFEYVT